jgi:hypothetical protein
MAPLAALHIIACPTSARSATYQAWLNGDHVIDVRVRHWMLSYMQLYVFQQIQSYGVTLSIHFYLSARVLNTSIIV